MRGPARIATQFGQNGIGSPAGMAVAQRDNGLAELGQDGAERPSRWPADWGSEPGTAVTVPNPPPVATGPDRRVERGGTLGIGLPCPGALETLEAFLSGA